MGDAMFCYQCQETAGNSGCIKTGICGKEPKIAAMQDLLVFLTKGLSEITTKLRKEGKEIPKDINYLITNNLFITITNANFDEDAIIEHINSTMDVKNTLFKQLLNKNDLSDAALWNANNKADMTKKAVFAGILSTKNEDVRSLRELIIYGIKGLAAYTKHSNILGFDDEDINLFLQETLAKTLDEHLSTDDLFTLAIQTGKTGVACMKLLDKANTSSFGHPEFTKVNIGVGVNPGILISGHDLKDLHMLLSQTEGTGVDVYTHSEMLAGNYYPRLKKYKHFVGNYGNSWHLQREDFNSFNGPVIMTTNCLIPPKDSYKDRIYTTGAVGFPGCKYISGNIGEIKDFSEVIEHAKKCKPPVEIEKGEIIGGFAHNQVFELSDKLAEVVNSGDVKKFVVMAGCDGSSKARNYYTNYARSLPNNTIILTAGCAKYRYNKLNLGDIKGIPRVLDAGQCNDCYSLLLIALKLKEILNVNDINELPIIYNIAWYEQKAVIVLLALLHLGIKNIQLGPTLPAFLSQNVVKTLVKDFGISCIS